VTPVRVGQLALTDFRCYASAELAPAPAVTVIEGANGEGKTSLLEAVGWVAMARSFRGVPDAALVRAGADAAVLRAEVLVGERARLLEIQIRAVGRNRVRVDRHAVTRTRDQLGVLRVTVFAPDDLQLVKGAPAERRGYLDDLLVAIAPRYDGVRADYERVLRQRNALLRQGSRARDALDTLEVFDEQLVRAGAELIRGRLRLVDRLVPVVAGAYRSLTRDDTLVEATYEAEWAEGAPQPADVDGILRAALAARRPAELDRGVTMVGPHRDEWRLRLHGLDARTHASQGEQRTLALALRLAGHRVCADEIDAEPVLLLDDVFSELDPERAAALVEHLPAGQTIITTANTVPASVHPARRLRVARGAIEDVT
jgi:DNA replication and repair protein RecF